MLKKILIANRNEIAVRIIRAAKGLGIETVAIYSTADKDALHVKLATQAICVGGPLPRDSYLNMHNIVSAALLTGCDAIHPGYGFLAENTTFARLVQDHGLVFIGPDCHVIDIMGDKAKARETMMAQGIPVVPGSGALTDVNHGKTEAEKIGYPVLIKASAGGGGKGMRICHEPADFEKTYHMATAEALGSFGNGQVYLEKYVINPKHIEWQVIGDSQGNVVHLYERDCSVQRHHQKIIEEAPCQSLREDVRQRMATDVIKAAKAVNYQNAGTFEFILDADQNYYFIEMNTRIQVEHPVTEMITGIDLIKEMIRVASGLPLSFTQADVAIHGYSMECRINAENPASGFTPSAGRITHLRLPSGFGVRMDTALYPEASVPPFYDSLVGKLIVHGNNRPDCVRKMRGALQELVIEGIDTNCALHQHIFHSIEFVEGQFDTGFLPKLLAKKASTDLQ